MKIFFLGYPSLRIGLSVVALALAGPLAEAEERRKAAEAAAQQAPTELNGRGGLDPARYGDWEVKGIISDF